MVGIYAVEDQFDIKISKDQSQLYTQLTGQNAFPIFPEDKLFFFLKVVDAQLQFEEDEKGAVTKVYLLQNGKKIEAKKIK